MHSLLKRQLKKTGLTEDNHSKEQFEKFIQMVEQTYHESDEDRLLLENTLSISSKEMQELYKRLEKTSQNRLDKSEDKYSRLVQNLKNYYFFYTQDCAGRFTYLSDSITQILGYSQENFLTRFEKHLSDDDMNTEALRLNKLSRLGDVQAPYQVSIYHNDGTIRYLEITEVPVFNQDGKILFIDGIARDVSNQYRAEKKIEHLAKHDVLTGLANRLYLEEQLQNSIYAAQRLNTSLALLFLDLDHFKNINDTLGHDIGDKLLQEVSNRIKPNIRHEDLFARLGGDEIVIILTNINDDYLTIIINKIIKLMRDIWNIDNYELRVSTSMGIALYPQDASTMRELMKNADIAMYKAKELGRDNFSFFTDELNEKVHKDMKLEQDMSNALASNQFVLYYQPKQRLVDDLIIGAEGLIRWNHPEFGLIAPDSFISLAENTGFIIKLGEWIIEEACRSIARFNAVDSSNLLHLSVNVSTRQLQNNDLYKVIQNSLANYDINPRQLSLEITESVMIENSDKMVSLLEKISSLGVNICLDDFGTGFSSLSYLHKLPISSLKIDKSFIDEIPKHGNKKIILDTIITMGETLNITVLAEGVEEEYQRQYLIDSGCLYYQGFLFYKALKESSYVALLKS